MGPGALGFRALGSRASTVMICHGVRVEGLQHFQVSEYSGLVDALCRLVLGICGRLGFRALGRTLHRDMPGPAKLGPSAKIMLLLPVAEIRLIHEPDTPLQQ